MQLVPLIKCIVRLRPLYCRKKEKKLRLFIAIEGIYLKVPILVKVLEVLADHYLRNVKSCFLNYSTLTECTRGNARHLFMSSPKLNVFISF